MIPTADPNSAGELAPLLVILVGAFGHQQRRVADAKLKPVIVTDLRIARAVGARGITIVKANLKAELIAGIEYYPDARRGKRIARTAAWKISRRD